METNGELTKVLARASTRGAALLILLATCVFADTLGLATGFAQLRLLLMIQNGEEVSDFAADLSDFLYGGVGLIQALVFVLTAVVWLVWLKAAYKNLTLVGSRRTKFTPGWAVGYWFVPFINLVRPYQIMKELWNRSDDENQSATDSLYTPSILPAWWATWILSNFAGNLMFRQSLAADDLASFLVSTKTGLINDGLTVLAGSFAIFIVLQIWKRQKAFSTSSQVKT